MRRVPWLAVVLVTAGSVLVLWPSHPAPTAAPRVPATEAPTSSTPGRPARAGDRSTSTSAIPAPTMTTSSPIPVTVAATTTTRATDAFETRTPWLQYLPHSEPSFSIDFTLHGDRPALTVTLVAIVNRADQLAQRRAELTAAKAAALEWLAAHGATPGSYDVAWLPADAAAL